MGWLQHLLLRLDHPTSSGMGMPGIDGLRAVAVTLVLVFHVYGFGAGSPSIQVGGLDLRPWLSTGFMGVYLFFVLSGFLLILPWTKSHYTGAASPSIRTYFLRRALRIVPAYYVHLAAFFLILVPLGHSFATLISPLGLASVLAHLSFTQYLFPWTSSGFGINGALWTLTIEAIFYVILPIVAKHFLGARAMFGLLLALALTELWNYLSFSHLYDLVASLFPHTATITHNPLSVKIYLALQFPSHALYFAVGMAASNLLFLSPGLRPNGTTRSAFAALALAGLFGVMWFVARTDVWNTHWLYIWHVIAATVLGCLVLLAADRNAVSRYLLGAPPVRIVGIISYSIYLWHLPIIYVMKTYLTPDGLTGSERFAFLLLTCGTLTLFTAFVSYTLIELPFMQWRAEHRKRLS